MASETRKFGLLCNKEVQTSCYSKAAGILVWTLAARFPPGFLSPVAVTAASPLAAMKVRSALKQMCKKCKIIKRGKKQLVICPENARHKQRQAFSTMTASPFPFMPAEFVASFPALSLSPLSSVAAPASALR